MMDEMAGAAYHEAGHAVVAKALEAEVVRVSIEHNLAEGRWDGKTERSPKQVQFEGTEGGMTFVDPSGPLNEIAVAWAGFLAQARFTAAGQGGGLTFARGADWSQLFTWMSDPQPERQQPYLLRFAGGDTPAAFVAVQPRWFGGKDRTVYLQNHALLERHSMITPQLGRLLLEKLAETMESLERDWHTVARVAEALISKWDGSAAVLSQAECQTLL